MAFGDRFPVESLPAAAVPSRKRRFILIGLVWFVGLGFVIAAQIELASTETDALNAVVPVASGRMETALR